MKSMKTDLDAHEKGWWGLLFRRTWGTPPFFGAQVWDCALPRHLERCTSLGITKHLYPEGVMPSRRCFTSPVLCRTLACVALLLLALPGFAQTATCRVLGTVTD